MMGRFNSVISDLELIDFALVGCCYTWSNEKPNATMTRIDRILVTPEWDAKFPNYQLTPASSSSSDHCPFLLQLQPIVIKHFKGFRFETSWLAREGFLDIVKKAWDKHVATSDSIQAPCTSSWRGWLRLYEPGTKQRRDWPGLFRPWKMTSFFIWIWHRSKEFFWRRSWR